MGKHNLNDERNALVFSFCNWVKALQPRYFIMENVPGLKQRNNAPLLKKLLTKFKKAGYSCLEPLQILNAADFGVPQNRRRLFILGTRKGEVPLSYPSPLFNTAPTVRDAIKDLPNLDDFPELINRDELMLKPARLEILEASASLYVQQLRELVISEDNYSYIRHWNPLLLTGFRRTQHTLNSIERFQNTPAGEQEKISRLRRLEWGGRCHTLRAGTGVERGSFTSARPLHPYYHRVISVREAARLHSFPDWFRFHTTKWHGFRQVGNSVPPLLAKALGQEVMKALQVTPVKPSEVLELGNPELLKMTPTRAMREVCTFGKETSRTKL